VTIGGDRWDGVTSIMDWGRIFGGLGLRFRGPGWSVPLLGVPMDRGAVPCSPEDVRGLSLLPSGGRVREGCRFSIGDGGFCSTSLPRFSNLDRNDDTGLIEASSVLVLPSTMSDITEASLCF